MVLWVYSLYFIGIIWSLSRAFIIIIKLWILLILWLFKIKCINCVSCRVDLIHENTNIVSKEIIFLKRKLVQFLIFWPLQNHNRCITFNSSRHYNQLLVQVSFLCDSYVLLELARRFNFILTVRSRLTFKRMLNR